MSLAPHREGATTAKLLLKVREAAETYHVPIHIHVSETKLDFDGSPVSYTHLDVYKRQQLLAELGTLEVMGLICRETGNRFHRTL